MLQFFKDKIKSLNSTRKKESKESRVMECHGMTRVKRTISAFPVHLSREVNETVNPQEQNIIKDDFTSEQPIYDSSSNQTVYDSSRNQPIYDSSSNQTIYDSSSLNSFDSALY